MSQERVDPTEVGHIVIAAANGAEPLEPDPRAVRARPGPRSFAQLLRDVNAKAPVTERV